MKFSISITKTGAVSDSTELQTGFIQKAIDACLENGGGTVIIPKGTYYTGDIRLRSNTTLLLEEGARLLGSNNPEDYFNYLHDTIEPLSSEQITDAPYLPFSLIKDENSYTENKPEYNYLRVPGSRWNNALIRAFNAENIKIIGQKDSIIDGCNCFDEKGESNYRGPHGITFWGCNNIELKGYTIKNTGNWAHNLTFCSNVIINSIIVLAGHDGVHATDCNNLSITDSDFYTGDDCIAGYGNVNSYISNCTLNSSCSAFRFGGTNMLAEHCHIFGPGKYGFRGALSDEEKRISAPSPKNSGRNNMLSAFTYYADYAMPIKVQPCNIIISDCKIENTDRFLHYNYSGNETWQKGSPLINIRFENIKASGIEMPLTLYGDENDKITFTMKNVEIDMQDKFKHFALINAANYESINLTKVSLLNADLDTVINKWTDGNINISGCSFGEVKTISKYSDTEFSAEPI